MSPLLPASAVEDAGGVDGDGTGRPDPQVCERVRRRPFTTQDMLDMVAEYDAPDGKKRAVLRRDGLHPATSLTT